MSDLIGPTGPGEDNTVLAELIAHDQVTLSQGTDTDVSVGAEMDDHLLVAYGFASDPGEDQAVTHSVFWDESAGTDGEQKVRFSVDAAASDPTINYSVYVITDTQQ